MQSPASSFKPFIKASHHDRPILKDLMIHVIPSVATKWYQLGVILLNANCENELNNIEADIKMTL